MLTLPSALRGSVNRRAPLGRTLGSCVSDNWSMDVLLLSLFRFMFRPFRLFVAGLPAVAVRHSFFGAAPSVFAVVSCAVLLVGVAVAVVVVIDVALSPLGGGTVS